MDKFLERQQKQFNRWASFYDASWFRYLFFEPTYRNIIKLLRIELLGRRTARMLDVACGTAEIIARLASEFPDVQFVGADIATRMIAVAHEKIKLFSNVSIVETSVTTLPSEDELFDIVLCSDAFHHFEDPREALRSIKRVMKPGGMLLLVDPAYDTFFQKIVFNVINIIDHAKKFYSRKAMEQLLIEINFKIGETQTQYWHNFYKVINN